MKRNWQMTTIQYHLDEAITAIRKDFEIHGDKERVELSLVTLNYLIRTTISKIEANIFCTRLEKVIHV